MVKKIFYTTWSKVVGKPTHCTYRSNSAFKTHEMKLPVHRFCPDVNTSGCLELCSRVSKALGSFTTLQLSTWPTQHLPLLGLSLLLF